MMNFIDESMTKIAYFDCPMGISGDMCLGAIADAGLPLSELAEQLRGLGIEEEYELRGDRVQRQGQNAMKVEVILRDGCADLAVRASHHSARHLPEIEDIIRRANLPPRVEDWSLQVFRQLAIAEGKVHGIAPERVHFHEVGATDAIVDIVGTCVGLDLLGVDRLYCSALPTGGGTVKAAHGVLPVPVPAVLKLWESRQIPVYSNGIEKELVTPTGAAIAVTLAQGFGPPPAMQLERVGLGAGSRDLPRANVLRLWLGTQTDSPAQETVTVLETQIDDLNPQAIGYAFDALLQAGALDVFTQAIGMKKSRPGILLTVICPFQKAKECEAILFRETTTLGIRHRTQARSRLEREIQTVETELGPVRVKVAYQGSGAGKTVINVQPEYEDCAELARKHQQPWRVVHQLVLDTWHRLRDRRSVIENESP